MRELDSKLIRDNGHWERRTWLSGAREDLGDVVQGWTGTETVVKRTVIKPVVIFEVRESPDYEMQARLGDVPDRSRV